MAFRSKKWVKPGSSPLVAVAPEHAAPAAPRPPLSRKWVKPPAPLAAAPTVAAESATNGGAAIEGAAAPPQASLLPSETPAVIGESNGPDTQSSKVVPLAGAGGAPPSYWSVIRAEAEAKTGDGEVATSSTPPPAPQDGASATAQRGAISFCVGNLSFEANTQSLRKLFGQAGPVESIRFLQPKQGHASAMVRSSFL